jgi:methylmalonyl-CoA mutase N-terminal domain/subunit
MLSPASQANQLPAIIAASFYAMLGSRSAHIMAIKSKDEQREGFQTSSGIDLPGDFNPRNTDEVDYDLDLGAPGEFPYTRGIYSNMYRGRLWTMRQYAGYATAEVQCSL